MTIFAMLQKSERNRRHTSNSRTETDWGKKYENLCFNLIIALVHFGGKQKLGKKIFLCKKMRKSIR